MRHLTAEVPFLRCQQIAVDDLRPMFSDLEPDRFGFMKTPNMNAFMKDALALRQSHVQQVCPAL